MDDHSIGWTASQRRVLLLLLVLLLVALVARYACNPMRVSSPQPAKPGRADDLADRIDPNTADWESLAALPGIGERRAKDIVAYREQSKPDAGHPYPFTQPFDLMRIKGVGPAIVAGMEPHLVFPSSATRATTEPSPK